MKMLLPLLTLFCSSMAQAAKITVPIDVGVGPSALTWTGDLADDQPWHFGLSISAAAIIDQKTLKKHKKKIPKQYRSQLKKMDEIRVGYLLIPDTLILSPKRENTGMFGATWSPISLGIPAEVGNSKMRLGVDALLTYTYIDSDLENIGTTHFLRIGIGPGADLEVPLGETFLFSLHWRSGIYIPQQIGGGVGDLGPILEGQPDESIWHVGQGSFQLHYRFPYSTRI